MGVWGVGIYLFTHININFSTTAFLYVVGSLGR